MSVRVRFAPSPTGFLHIGGARTALFNWLFARRTGGAFILRIEDTDSARNSSEAVEVILAGLRWLGLKWDEGPVSGNPDGPNIGGFGPYFQSRRADIYRRRAEELLRRGSAYGHEGAVKFRMPREPMVIPDLVVGEVRRELTDRELADPDFIILRSDGLPVFHFVNVVDDMEMGITHVIRGEDHLSNAGKHLALFHAFGVEPPKYAHIPLILNPDGTKMSKRDAGASLSTYIEGGYAPEAVANFLCLLGWSPKDNREILPLQDVVRVFDLSQILRHNARFDAAKLSWMNAEYLRAMESERFLFLAKEALAQAGMSVESYDSGYVSAAIATCQAKVKLLSEIPSFCGFYFTESVEFDSVAARQEFVPQNKPPLERLRAVLSQLTPFDAAHIESLLKGLAVELSLKAGPLIHLARLACTGQTFGPSIYSALEVLGQERVLQRLDRALSLMG